MLKRLIAAAKPRPSASLIEHVEAIRAIAAEHRATEVRVFGSAAREEDGLGSDLDLLVSFVSDASLYDQVGLKEDLEALLGVSLDVVSADALTSRHASILREARPL